MSAINTIANWPLWLQATAGFLALFVLWLLVPLAALWCLPVPVVHKLRASACFVGALGLAARDRHVALPADTAVDAEVDLGTGTDGYALQARLNVSLPGVPRDVALALVHAAHQTCPYSKMSRGNIDVNITVA